MEKPYADTVLLNGQALAARRRFTNSDCATIVIVSENSIHHSIGSTLARIGVRRADADPRASIPLPPSARKVGHTDWTKTTRFF